MISVNSLPSTSSFDLLKTVTFQIDDKVITRDGTLFLATFDGVKWQGPLVDIGLSYARGYMVYFSGAVGSEIKQSSEPQVSVQHVVLSMG